MLLSNPNSKEELKFLVGEWQRQPLTKTLLAHLNAEKAEALKGAIHGRRDHQVSLQKLERASVLGEIIDNINLGTFIK
jgi:Na+-transporting NADH:ubiquinone oxidoreductase subunit NqrA